jgi:hypothetical protein
MPVSSAWTASRLHSKWPYPPATSHQVRTSERSQPASASTTSWDCTAE